MSFPSRDEHAVHAQPASELHFVRATHPDAEAVTAFLLEQDVRPAPREADISALLGRNDAALFYAVSDGQIRGLTGGVRDGEVCRLIHSVWIADQCERVGTALIDLVEREARDSGAAMIVAEAVLDSPMDRFLRAGGFTADWEEDDASNGSILRVVVLIKSL